MYFCSCFKLFFPSPLSFGFFCCLLCIIDQNPGYLNTFSNLIQTKIQILIVHYTYHVLLPILTLPMYSTYIYNKVTCRVLMLLLNLPMYKIITYHHAVAIADYTHGYSYTGECQQTNGYSLLWTRLQFPRSEKFTIQKA